MATITATITEPGLVRLMTWLSPGFPVGGYAFSHGIEFAVEQGLVANVDDLAIWIESSLCQGTGRVDGQLFAIAWSAVEKGDDNLLAWAVERADAMRGSAELALESTAQGEAFLRIVRDAWSDPRLDRWVDELAALGRSPSYPIAVSVASASFGIPVRPALTAFYQAFAANLISAGVRLVPLGQTEGQQALARLVPKIEAAVETALNAQVENLGAAVPVIDWASMSHETQHTRLFRS